MVAHWGILYNLITPTTIISPYYIPVCKFWPSTKKMWLGVKFGLLPSLSEFLNSYNILTLYILLDRSFLLAIILHCSSSGRNDFRHLNVTKSPTISSNHNILKMARKRKEATPSVQPVRRTRRKRGDSEQEPDGEDQGEKMVYLP